MAEIRRLAILNRGEPAMRALDAVAELNRDGSGSQITAIVVHTDPDAQSWFVRTADEAINLGPATFVDPADGSRKSAYLDEERVVAALAAARADAVWVGWGFVAEHASFAQLCEEAGIIFVGPDSATIRMLGDKVAAKQLAEKVGVPVVPWSAEPVETVEEAAAHADRLGYPVTLKAAAGGGGRGIRVIREPGELAGALQSARSEAVLAFGDPQLFLERQIEQARHVEVQIISDGQGTTWALGVRDCSVQRRHQKVIEESASTVLDPAAEQAIKAAAVRLADAAGYRNAGTVEFLVQPDTGQFMFMEVNTRLQVEHPVTEETTGVDLVKLQLHVARGGRLDGAPPPTGGHAVEARLCAEDPEQGFAPAPGRIALWRPPAGPGIRVDAGVTEGDTVAPEFDSLIAKIVAWGHDRNEAFARLRRALARATVVIEGGTSNRSFLLALLDHPQLRAGEIDTRWLDRVMAEGGLLPPAEPFAVLVAAIEAYDVDEAAARAAFHAGARRGRPQPPEAAGHRVRLRYRSCAYQLTVYRTGPTDYQVDTGEATVPVRVERLGTYERRVTSGDRSHRVVANPQRSSFLLDIDGSTHRVLRDDGGVIRADSPAFVVAVHVAPGDQVATGDPLVVLESMKMATTVNAPFAGQVVEVSVSVNTQIDQAAPLLRIRETGTEAAAVEGDRLDFAGLERAAATGGRQRGYEALHSYLMGFDLDPAAVAETLAEQRRLAAETSPDDAELLAEDRLLELFADVSALYRPQPEPGDPGEDGLVTSAQEHVLSYLQWLDADRAGLPEPFVVQLGKLLARYGVPDLEPTPELDEAVVWMWRSFQRADEMVPAVSTVLERRMRGRDVLAGQAGPELRALLGRLAAASQARYPEVAELARDLIFRYFDEPLLERSVAKVHAEMAGYLDALAADPHRPDRAALVQQLVQGPQPMRPTLLRRWATAAPAFQQVLLDVHLRRFYRIRPLHDIRFEERQGHALGTADYEFEGKRVHVVAVYGPLDELPQVARSVAEHLETVDPTRLIVLDLSVWRHGDQLDSDQLAEELRRLLDGCPVGRPLHRVDFTVTSNGPHAEPRRPQHFVFRQRDGVCVEEVLYRDLHPMMAKRLELWRLANFTLQRLPSVEDVYLFRGVARDNPADVRLFAVAEVRDLTPVWDESGQVVALPLLERMGMQSLAAMRRALAGMPAKRRPQSNRIVLYVRPPLTVPHEQWPDLARPYQALAAAANLEKLQLRVRIPDGEGVRDEVLEFSGSASGDGEVRMRERSPAGEPIRPLTEYRQKVLRANRVGAPYPYEIIRMLTPGEGVTSVFPPGRFEEYDLDDAGELVPVDRPYGRNAANLVVGLVTSYPPNIPEGMTRVAILGDPTRRLGSLAEPECRRIMAGLDLAKRLRVPVEWFALSSGARIAMDSGVENMDWIAAVLRRLVEFTQAGGEVNIMVTGINVGAQPYWNAEATMLMHTKGILVMTPSSAMVLTGKQALDFSGGVSAEDNYGIGGFERVMGPNGQAQYWAPTLQDACQVLMRHYEYTYVVPGERYPRRRPTADPADRDVRSAPHAPVAGSDFTTVGDVFSAERNAERKKPFDIRSMMRAVSDADAEPLERWARWRSAECAVVWDSFIGGIPVCLLGMESRTLARRGFLPADGPPSWTSGTLFPQSSRKVARAINAASGNRPLVMLANLSGFDGSPESMRRWQLEYGAEIGRAVVNFRGPIVFVVVSRYHGGAFVVFSNRLNEQMEIAAVDGSYASVIGGAPAAGVVFVREVEARTDADPRVAELRERLTAGGTGDGAGGVRAMLHEVRAAVRAEKLGEVAAEFDGIHSIQRAQQVGSVDRIIPASDLRPYIIDAIERGMAATE